MKRNHFLLPTGDLIDEDPARVYGPMHNRETGKAVLFVQMWNGEVHECKYASGAEANGEKERLRNFLFVQPRAKA